MAQTINGIIARNNYDEDFLSHENWKVFLGLTKEMDCFIVGRKTYEEVKKWKEYNFDKIKATKIIISNNPDFKLNKGYTLASSPEDALKKASKLGFKKILLSGGGTINSAFMKDSLVDEIIINVEPFVLGNGIRIFSQENFESKLRLLDVKRLKSGIIQLRYKIIK
jgi:dihydrofolate reductase